MKTVPLQVWFAVCAIIGNAYGGPVSYSGRNARPVEPLAPHTVTSFVVGGKRGYLPDAPGDEFGTLAERLARLEDDIAHFAVHLALDASAINIPPNASTTSRTVTEVLDFIDDHPVWNGTYLFEAFTIEVNNTSAQQISLHPTPVWSLEKLNGLACKAFSVLLWKSEK